MDYIPFMTALLAVVLYLNTLEANFAYDDREPSEDATTWFPSKHLTFSPFPYMPTSYVLLPPLSPHPPPLATDFGETVSRDRSFSRHKAYCALIEVL
ncbi:hypothetical protein Btru_033923 [Bulinus truncatus]|nr:hypothetical protein Btru_033923 [Bulinus truncatus]